MKPRRSSSASSSASSRAPRRILPTIPMMLTRTISRKKPAACSPSTTAASIATLHHSAGVSDALARAQRAAAFDRIPGTLRLLRGCRNSDRSAPALGDIGSPAMSLEALRKRMAELSDLTAIGRLAARDQGTMMPPAGGPGRGEQMATLERLAHQRATADEVGEWLDELETA